MGNTINQDKLYHQHLIRLDDTLNEKLLNHMNENEMTLTGVVRKSLRKYFESETPAKTEKTMPMK